MKNKLFLAGLLSLLLAAGLVLTGCKQEADDDGGGSATLKVVNELTTALYINEIYIHEGSASNSKRIWTSESVQEFSVIAQNEDYTFTNVPAGRGYINVIIGPESFKDNLPPITGEVGKTTTVTISGSSIDDYTVFVGDPQ